MIIYTDKDLHLAMRESKISIMTNIGEEKDSIVLFSPKVSFSPAYLELLTQRAKRGMFKMPFMVPCVNRLSLGRKN